MKPALLTIQAEQELAPESRGKEVFSSTHKLVSKDLSLSSLLLDVI